MALSEKQKRFIRKNYEKRSPARIARELNADKKEVEAYCRRLKKRPEPRQLDPGRKRVFVFIAALIPLIFIISLEVGLRLFNYGGMLDLFITAPDEYSNYYMCNPSVMRRYFFMQSSVPTPPNDIFLKKKPAGTYRIFVLGGSTTAGYPYESNLMFSRMLQHRLLDVFPDKRIEIINTATAAINSYTLLDFTDEILANNADALLIYAGHNEFYGALGVASAESLGRFRGVVKLYLKLKRFKIFLLLRDIIGGIRKTVARVLYGGNLHLPSATLMERLVADQQIAYGSELYALGREQFRQNLREILKKAQKAGVRVLLSELISNVRDQKPFISTAVDGLPAADVVYQQAKRLESRQKFTEAREKFYQAKDLDALRFRAAEDFNNLIDTVAAEFDVPVVPMKRYFEAASEHGLIGNNLILEHLHPNIKGYFLMAEAFFDAMKTNGFIAPSWDVRRIKPLKDFRAAWGKTALDSLYGDLRIRILKGGWPFKPKATPNRAFIDYRPSTRAESLAVKIWRDDTFNMERAHVKMPAYFEKRGDYLSAFKEYRALMTLTPYNVSPYLRASDVLIKAKKFARAMPILRQTLTMEETPFANKWIGTILLNGNQVQAAIPYLEKSFRMKGDDPQLLYNLSGAYALNAQYQKAKQMLNKLYKINPNFPDAGDLKRQLERIR